MAPRKQPKSKPQQHELEAFAERYDTLALIYGDPVKVVFSIMAASAETRTTEGGVQVMMDPEVALRAADMLMSYRYPKVKATEGSGEKAPVLNFNLQMAPPQALDVGKTPTKLLVIEGVKT